MEVSVENLFDQTYYNYLTASAATGPSGSPGTTTNPRALAPGDSVPGVGRSFNLTARWRF